MSWKVNIWHWKSRENQRYFKKVYLSRISAFNQISFCLYCLLDVALFSNKNILHRINSWPNSDHSQNVSKIKSLDTQHTNQCCACASSIASFLIRGSSFCARVSKILSKKYQVYKIWLLHHILLQRHVITNRLMSHLFSSRLCNCIDSKWEKNSWKIKTQ